MALIYIPYLDDFIRVHTLSKIVVDLHLSLLLLQMGTPHFAPPIPNALYQRIRFHLVDMEGCQRFLWASSRLFQSDLLVCVSSS